MTLTIIFLPLISFLLIGFFGRFLGNYFNSFIAIFNMFIAVILSIFIFIDMVKNKCTFFIEGDVWFKTYGKEIYNSFIFDTLSIIMIILITFISLMVYIYSFEYMKTDPNLSLFMAYLSIFSFFMLITVSAGNFLQMFLGWEGVGLSSYLLINFYTTRIQANKAALKALFVNKISDCFLLMGIIIIYTIFDSLDYATCFILTDTYCIYNLDVITFLGFIINKFDLICFMLMVSSYW
jgi:NADH:ubiquinone oxidoreductase subunit 5 (subunit L)/multisubunit Na+/H+ antiporter MnhA subunit